jgi:hypothetical protein
MKKKVTREALEQFISNEIAQSQRCPNGLRIRIEPRPEGGWKVVPLETTDPLCLKRVAAIGARFQVDFELVD